MVDVTLGEWRLDLSGTILLLSVPYPPAEFNKVVVSNALRLSNVSVIRCRYLIVHSKHHSRSKVGSLLKGFLQHGRERRPKLFFLLANVPKDDQASKGQIIGINQKCLFGKDEVNQHRGLSDL